MEQSGVLTLLEKVAFLRKVNLFAGTPDNILAEIAAICKEDQAEAETTLIRKGEQGDCMYILVEGGINIEQNGQHLASLAGGAFFGELSLLETEVRSADAITTSDSLLLRIDQDDFFELIEDRVEVMRAILVTLAKRIRNQNTLIESLKK
jgi:CRP-like cAMP-binding protein